MAKKSDKPPRMRASTLILLRKAFAPCFQEVGVSREELRRLLKKNPKKAKRLMMKLYHCVVEKPRKR